MATFQVDISPSVWMVLAILEIGTDIRDGDVVALSAVSQFLKPSWSELIDVVQSIHKLPGKGPHRRSSQGTTVYQPCLIIDCEIWVSMHKDDLEINGLVNHELMELTCLIASTR